MEKIIYISGKAITIQIQRQWYSINDCSLNKNKLYVFGDNLKRVGMAGQASIRNIYNAVGLATKKAPSNEESAFFTDNELQLNMDYIRKDINNIFDLLMTRSQLDTLVFPLAGLGTGLSKLPTKAPKTFVELSKMLEIDFGVKTNPQTYEFYL